jgi:hypothetical protein
MEYTCTCNPVSHADPVWVSHADPVWVSHADPVWVSLI